jgi:acyl carrier protein
LAVGIEERFGITMVDFEELDMERLASVGDLIDVIVGKF